ncbi:MAG: DUF1178 family protein [Proteobacteria bacterium]|nr:DUF1178 family protein [Pseudomonadota bacterium]
MIKYNLKCDKSHVFEAWFKNSTAYDDQAARGIVFCAICGSNHVQKAPMAPSVPKKGSAEQSDATTVDMNQAAAAMSAIRELRQAVEDNCDYVGPKFAEEARKIHYGEVEERGIYGEASAEEKTELKEEGVEIAEIPWLPQSDA